MVTRIYTNSKLCQDMNPYELQPCM